MLVSLHDHSQIAQFLSQDPGRYLYEIGDLDPFFWPQTLWFGWQKENIIKALCLIYLGDQTPILLAMGSSASQIDLLQSLNRLLPMAFYAHLAPGLEACFKDWLASGGESYHRMMLKPDKWRPQTANQQDQIKLLAAADLEQLLSFYQAAYPENWFNPRMLATGQYLGLFRAEQLMAVAGVHVFSAQQQVAALGNIAVSKAARGQGLGQIISSALCAQLLKQVQQIGLNVASQNQAAIHCYQKLGFEVYLDYQEWSFTRPSSRQNVLG